MSERGLLSWQKDHDPIWDRPCAVAGLTSYRYRGRYGYIMIGATSDEDAEREARRSTVNVTTEFLERWDGERYVPVMGASAHASVMNVADPDRRTTVWHTKRVA